MGALWTMAILQAVTLAGLITCVALTHRLRERIDMQIGAVLATLAAEDPLPPAIGTPPEPPVLDARDLTDEQLFAEVLRRNSGHHDPDEQT